MARRAKGEGTLYFDEKRQSWRWYGHYVDRDGVKRTKNFYAKRQIDVKRKVNEFFEQIKEKSTIDKTISVSAWIDLWLESYVSNSVKLTTYEIYRQKMKYVSNFFGKKPLYLVTSLEFQNFLNGLHKTGGEKGEGLSAATVNTVRRYFKICCNSAVENGVILKNPVLATKPIRKVKSDITILSEEEVKLVLSIAKEGDYIYEGISDRRLLNYNKGTEYLLRCYYVLIHMALSTGMRIGELRGLSWEYVNLDKKYVEVRNQIVSTSRKLIFEEPKTLNSKRKIVVDDNLIEELAAYKEYQQAYSDMLADHFNNAFNLVFTNTFGSPIDLHNFRVRYFNKILKRANVNSGFTIHCMRHTHASLLLKNGVNVKVVSERLGHSTVTITLNTYAHIIESMEYSASNTWSTIING